MYGISLDRKFSKTSSHIAHSKLITYYSRTARFPLVYNNIDKFDKVLRYIYTNTKQVNTWGLDIDNTLCGFLQCQQKRIYHSICMEIKMEMYGQIPRLLVSPLYFFYIGTGRCRKSESMSMVRTAFSNKVFLSRTTNCRTTFQDAICLQSILIRPGVARRENKRIYQFYLSCNAILLHCTT